MERVLYVSDLDGTLLNRQDRISPFSIRTINGLVEEGMLFTYATARSIESARTITGSLKLTHEVLTVHKILGTAQRNDVDLVFLMGVLDRLNGLD